MPLPAAARDLALRRAASVPFAELKRASVALSATYRERQSAQLSRLSPELRVAAYLVTRMPATFAAASAVLSEARARIPAEVTSILDLGAGTGAASFAARQEFPLAALTASEPDAAFAEAGRELLPDAVWQARDFTSPSPLPSHDFVIAAYSLGEAQAAALDVAVRMWAAARIGVAVIEPGTPAGYSLVLRIRDRLLAEGAYMVAPCPAPAACPLRENDWCHFAARTERSSLHRRLKEGTLGYEDEKYSYVALSKLQASLAPARVIRRPVYQRRLITLELCEAPRAIALAVPHRDRDLFRCARRASWGGAWPP